MRHGRHPHLYFDSNVILDAILDRNEISKGVLARAATHKWKCTTSRFTFAEILDTLQKEHQKKLSRPITVRQLNRIYDNLNDLVERDYSHIEFEKPSQPEFWDHVEWIAGMSSVRARDAIHCATAYGDLSDLIVTRDRPFLAASERVPIRLRVPISLPRNLDLMLVDIGFIVDEHGQAVRT